MDLPEGFEFLTAETEQDLEDILDFNSKVHEDDPQELRRVIENLPGFGLEMNYFIRDVDTGMIVSAMNAIPSTWAYEGIPLRNLELGWVGTLKEYRKRGFVRALYSHFDSLLKSGNHDISVIQGIPHYYRQFGYEFILPLGRRVTLSPHLIPEIKKGTEPSFMKMSVREAVDADLDEIVRLFDDHNKRLLVYSMRSRELWEVQERTKKEYENDFATMVIEENGRINGYFRYGLRKGIKDEHQERVLHVNESSVSSYDGVMRALHFLRQETLHSGACRIELVGPDHNNLCRVSQDLGGKVLRWWKQQIRIPDMVRFLTKIIPVLETRLKGTMFHGLTHNIALNTHRNCYVLRFKEGKIAKVEDLGIQSVGEKNEFRAPSHDLVKLILGDSNIDELNRANIDFLVEGRIRSLVETLFPKRESCIYYYMC
ncbi:MAG: GNAT family N-acetyltransferase [Candidatus Thorarchaeota archaeon]